MLLLVSALHTGAHSDPNADPDAVVLSGSCARFSLLTERLVRMEHTATGTFDDRGTFAVVNRKLPVPAFRVHRTNTTTVITTAALQITHNIRTCSASGFGLAEVQVELHVHPFGSWISGQIEAPDLRPSSVAHITHDVANLNGTMNHGPSF